MEIKSNMIVYISLLCREGSPKEAQLGTMLGNGSTVGFDQGGAGRRKEDGFAHGVNPVPGICSSRGYWASCSLELSARKGVKRSCENQLLD